MSYEIDQDFCCVDCQWNTMPQYGYAVFDELWAAAGMAPDGGMLCLACLEDRIGRQLALDDLEPPWVMFPKNPEFWTTGMRENWARRQEKLLGTRHLSRVPA